METTFLNGDKKHKAKGLNHLESRQKDFEIYQNDFGVYEKGSDDLPPFFEYGLCFDYVEPDTFDDQDEGYFRYQLSYGGPSDEIRFYHDGTVEYVYLDWFVGVGFDITDKPWVIFLQDDFESMDMLNVEHYEN